MNASPPKRRRRFGLLTIVGLTLVIGLAVGFISGLIETLGGSGTKALQASVLGIGVVLGLLISIRWWRDADEAVREAHKWAWYWGGSAGIAVVVALFVLSGWDLITLNIPPYGDGPDGMLLSGSALTLGLMLAGYLVAWAAWWLRHR
jgi:hypothetical protein